MKEIKLLVDESTNVITVTAISRIGEVTCIGAGVFDLSKCKDNICKMQGFIIDEHIKDDVETEHKVKSL